ncbi:MAG: hypothetical protein ACYC5O_11230 [Anaerolineae bacterium]
MNATVHFATAGMMPLAGLVGGALGQAFGLRGAVAVGAIGSTLAFLWVLLSSVRRVRTLPQTETA